MLAILGLNLSAFSTLTSPTLSSPANNAINVSTNASLSWNASFSSPTYTDYYDFQVDTTLSFNSTLLKSGSIQAAYGGTSAEFYYLHYNTKYYWRIRSRNTTDTSAWSAVWHFTTGSIIMTPVSPANGATGISTNATITWNTSISNPYTNDYCDYQVDTTITFNSALLRSGSAQINYYTSAEFYYLHYNTKYYWRIRSRNGTDTSAWSAVWHFTTELLTGIKETNNNASNITVYPNPAINNIKIETPQQAVIEITNMQGQLIKTIRADENKISIDVSALPSGVYFIKCITEKGIEIKKFVKE